MNKNPEISEFLLKEHGQYEPLIQSFIRDCSALTDDIIAKVVKKTIKRFNEKMDNYIFDGDYSPYFTPFDCYCVFWYKDWGSWELRDKIRDCIENFLELEYDNLTQPEQLVLNYAYTNDEFETDWLKVLEELYSSFMAEVEVHLQLKKIQEFLSKL